MRKLHCLILALSAVACAASLSAQYTRTESSAAYVERTGAGMNLLQPESAESADDTAFLVDLPFRFPFFDRDYDRCYASSNGRVTFSEPNAQTFAVINLTAPVGDATGHNTLQVIGGDLYAYPQDPKRTVKAYNEGGRVVIQWTNATFFSGSRILFLNFQCHLLDSGDIEYHYGPEFNPASMLETPNFTSGIVNIDGSVSYAGFGNMTTSQTTRPANGTLVSFTYTDTLSDTVVIEAGVVFPRTRYQAPATNAPVLSFRARAVGMGDTIDDLDFSFNDYAGSGSNVTLSLVEDTAPLGEYNGETSLASASNVGFGVTFSTLGLALTSGQTRNFLLVASFATLSQFYLINTFQLDNAVTPAPIQGGVTQHLITFTPAPAVAMTFDNPSDIPPPATAGETDVVLGSFDMHMYAGEPNRTITSLDYTLTFTGTLTGADVVNLRLYRDAGTKGQLDGQDTLLDTVPSVTTTLSFTGLSESLGQSGRCYLIVADVAAAMGGVGTIRVGHTTTFTDGIGVALSRTRVISNTASTLYFGPATGGSLQQWIALPNSTGVQAFTFHARAASGNGQVSVFQFDENSGSNYSSVAAARLYGDNGSVPGRYDATDTQIAGMFTVGATTMTFTPTVPIGLGSAGGNFHVVVDLNAGTTPFRTVLGAPTHTFTDFINVSFNGPVVTPTGNGANGVDLTYNLTATSFKIARGQARVLGTANVVARGTGGALPYLWFNLSDCPCGAGVNQQIYVEAWLEGAGPIGELDASDVLCYRTGATTAFGPGQLNALPAAGNLDLLFVARGALDLNNFAVEGWFTAQFAGVSGTEVRILPAPTTVPVYEIDIQRTNPKSGSNGGGGGDGGCTTGTGTGNWLGLFAVMMAMVIAARLRRNRA